jgi:hypothetical protein
MIHMTNEELAKSCPPGLSITEVIKWLRRRWHKLDYHALSPRASDINNGDCEEFAWAIIWAMGYEIENDEVEIRGDPFDQPDEFGNGPYLGAQGWPGHFWIEYKGKHYDADCADGVECWHDLPIFKSWIKRNKLKLRRTKPKMSVHA